MAFGDPGNTKLSGAPANAGSATAVPTREAPLKARGNIKAKPVTGAQRQRVLPKQESILDIAKRIGVDQKQINSWQTPSRSESIMRNVDMFNSDTRFAAARQFYDTKGAAFKFKPDEISGMISSGILAYGKVGETGYRTPTVGVNTKALDQFLRDNYKGTAGGGFVRTKQAREKGLGISDTFVKDASRSVENWNQGIRDLNPAMPAALLEDAPKKSVPGGEEYDYKKMATTYLKDEETYSTLTGKIVKEISSNGGSALLAKISENGATDQDIQDLRQYMYSPDSKYGKAQNRWVDETFYGGAQKQQIADATREASDTDQSKYLYEERLKEAAILEKEQAKDIEAANQLYFNTDPNKGAIIPKNAWVNNAASLVASGNGNLVSSTALNGIFYEDVGKGKLKDLTDSQKQAIYSGVLSALNNNMYVHPFMYTRALAFEKDLQEKGQLPDQQEMLNDAKRQANADYLGSTITKSVGAVPGIGPVIVSTGLLGGVTADNINESMAQGPLASTPLKDGFSLADLGANALKATVRNTISMPQGIYYSSIDPTGTAKAIAEDYKTRYGSVEGFKNSAYEDPTLPIMDALGLLSFAGMGIKGAQIAKITAAAKARKVTLGPKGIDMDAYNTQIDDYLNTAKADRNPDDLLPPSAFETEAPSIGVREYAKIARQAALGDERAAMYLGAILPDSDFGLNSAYVPTAMDKAAAFFEPRYRIITQQEGAPKRKTALADETVAALRETVPESPRAARIRFSGNPLSRGAQKINFYAQRGVGRVPGKVPQILSTLPGGYQFRFTRALREGDPAVLDLHAREMIYNRMFTESFKNLDLNDAEQLAVMDMASGSMYSAENLRTIAFKRVESARLAGLDRNDDPIIAMAEQDYKLFSDPSFVRELEKAKREMFPPGSGPRSERGEQLVAAAERMILLREKTSHLINHSWDDSRATRAMQLRYQVAMEAADLMPDTVFAELGRRVSKIVRMNPIIHLYEINRADVMDLPDEAGIALRDTVGVDKTDIKAVADQVEASLEYLRSDLTNRTAGATPLLVIEEEIPSMIGNRDFVIARRVRVEGEFLDPESGMLSREGLLDSQDLLLPKEFFLTVEKGKGKGRIRYWDNKKENEFGFTQAQERLNELVLNEMSALYPNARDFTDKVSSESMGGKRESFAQRKNFNQAVASGLLSFRYQEQVAAHAAAVRRRFDEDIKTLVDAQSEIIAIKDFDPQLHVAVRSSKVYPSRAAAETKLAAVGREGSNIQEVTTPDGNKAYILNLNYFDITAATMKEMRLRRHLGWDDDVAKAYFEEIENIKTTDPNQAVVVVPRYFYTNIANSYKRSQKLSSKILDSSTDIFKVLTLSLNPRFVPQQVIGSAVMLMMAYPEKAPAIMAKIIEHSTRRSHDKIKGIVNNDTLEYQNHSTDFNVMEEYMPRDVTENIYQQDMLATAQKKMPSKVMRYVLNSGYLMAFAWERNLRVAVGRKLAYDYPGFKAFAQSKVVKDYAKGNYIPEGMAPSMYATNSPFSAAFKLLADPESPFYDPMFLREVRHGTDMVSGNYRDFTDLERSLRNFLMPFYAWTRHSALFTKRMVQERPLTSNALAWMGNYGYEQTFEQGGLPEWLLGSLPMPQFLENILDLNPLMDNRVNVNSVMPFGTFGQTVAAGSNVMFGRKFGGSSAVDFLNPLAKQAIEQQTGRSLLTGVPIEDKGFPAAVVDGFQGYPVIAATIGLFKSQSQLNVMRGRENPESVFVDVNDPNSKLSIPSDKLSTKFETDSPAGLYNLFSPARAYSLDPAGLDKMIRSEYKAAGISIPGKSSPEYKGIFALINSLQKWKRKRDFIMNNYTPMNEKSNPELVMRAQQQLAAEFPKIPSSTPAGLVEKVLAGYVTLPGGD